MKLMKKTLALFTSALTMIMASFNAMAYSDVSNSSTAYEAIETLSVLDILTGFEDNTFKPEDKVTRAQMAAIICRASGYNYGETATQGSTSFTDVPVGHWAIAYIEMAESMGIINGYGEGLFGPEDEVTYDQAVKMIVCALGYQKKAEAMVKEGINPFPSAYNAIANQKGITNGVAKTAGGASRATIAELVYNALTVNLMDQTSFGTDIEFKEVKDQSLLYTKLNALKVKAKISSVSFDNTTDFVDITITEEDAVAKEDGVNFVGNNKVRKGNVNLVNAQGLEVNAIIDYSDSSDPKLLAIFPITKNSTELVIAADLIKGIEDNRVVYYKNTNSNTVSKSVKFAENIIVYFNAQTTNIETASDFQKIYLNSGKTANDKSYKFIINNKNVIDTIFIENAISFVVGRINYYDFEIYRDSTNTFNSPLTSFYGDYKLPLDLNTEDNENISYDIYNTKGESLKFDDIRTGDVLTVSQSVENGITYYEIIVSTGDLVEGIITEIRTEKVKNSEKEYKVYTIDGNDYVINGYEDASELEAGVSGSFQLTANNEIIAYELDKTIKNYGIVIATGPANSNFDKGSRAQIVTSDGVIKTYDFATKVYIDSNDPINTDADTVPSEVTALEHKVIRYELNSSNEIKKVSTSINDADVKYDTIETNSKYAAATGKLDGKYFTDNTKIVAIPSEDKEAEKDAYSFVSINSLTDEEIYTGHVIYNIDTKEVIFAFITNLITKPAFDSIPMVITSKATVSVDDSIRTKITGYIGHKEVSYVIADEEEVTKFDSENKAVGNIVDVDENDVIQFATNANDEIVAYRYLANWDGSAYTFASVVAANDYNVDDDVYGCGIKGKAIKVASKYIELDTANGNVDAFYNPDNTVYVYGKTYSKGETTSFDALRTFNDYENKTIDEVIDDIVYIYSYDGKNILNFVFDVNSDNK